MELFEDEQIRNIVNALPEPAHTVIIMYYSGKFKIKDIAQVLGMPTESVEKLHEEALKKIKKKIKDIVSDG